MSDSLHVVASEPIGDRIRGILSSVTVWVAVGVLAGVLLLISPPPEQTYPGAIPWADGSWLRAVVGALSLGGATATARGVEIKDLALHLGVSAALLVLAARAVVSVIRPPDRRTTKGAWFISQGFLAIWTLTALASATWSGDAEIAIGQAAIYGIAVAWAVALAWCIESRDVPRLLAAYVALAAAASLVCAWYYVERNPHHRPGFPVGNPGALAACILPAFVISAVSLAYAARGAIVQRQAPRLSSWLPGLVALACLTVGLRLTDSRSALVGLAFGLGGLAFIRATARVRLALVFAAVLASVFGVWYAASHNQDLAMARGATIRFRVYAWQYAALLWSHRPISGVGAGGYPRLATGLSTGDRALDPAAFMGDLVEHAHNELFEVFAEIGLIGGVTFVGGLLAACSAAATVLSSNLSPQRRGLLAGLTAGFLAIVGDSFVSGAARLPGPPAVQFTLLGALWAIARATSKAPANSGDDSASWRAARRYGVVAMALLGCALTAIVAARNWSGVMRERAAMLAHQRGEHESAAIEAHRADGALLDPVRKLLARELEVRSRAALALESIARWRAAEGESADPASVGALRDEAVAASNRAMERAAALSRSAPAFGRTAAIGAVLLEGLSELHRDVDPRQALQYALQAAQAWTGHRSQRPYDTETLLALCRYPSTMDGRIGLLRDALREGPMCDDWGAWRAEFEPARASPEFDATLLRLLDAARPYGPEAEADSLLIRGVPEMFRLAAAWRAARGDFAGAETDAGEAAARYRPLAARLPDRVAVALGEQAEYAFLADPLSPQAAIEHVRQALAALPKIQEQKLAASRRPLLVRLACYLLASGQRPEALAALEELAPTEVDRARLAAACYVSLAQRFLRDERDERTLPLREWLRGALREQPDHVPAWAWLAWLEHRAGGADAAEAILREAKAARVAESDLERIRASLRQEFPASQP